MRKNVKQDVTQAKKNVRRDARKNATKTVRRGARKKISERMSQKMPESMSERMSEDMRDEDHCYIYINPRGQRLTSVQQALQYAQNDKLRNRIAADMKAIQTDRFDHNSNIRVQFTSSRENYMHRGEHPTVSCRQGVQTYKNVSFVVSSTCVHICKHLQSHMSLMKLFVKIMCQGRLTFVRCQEKCYQLYVWLRCHSREPKPNIALGFR